MSRIFSAMSLNYCVLPRKISKCPNSQRNLQIPHTILALSRNRVCQSRHPQLCANHITIWILVFQNIRSIKKQQKSVFCKVGPLPALLEFLLSALSSSISSTPIIPLPRPAHTPPVTPCPTTPLPPPLNYKCWLLTKDSDS